MFQDAGAGQGSDQQPIGTIDMATPQHVPRYRFTLAQDKEAKEIAKGYERKGYSKERALSVGYATVQKQKARHIKHRRR